MCCCYVLVAFAALATIPTCQRANCLCFGFFSKTKHALKDDVGQENEDSL